MPSLDIHIAIARKYLKKYDDIKDKIAFIKGNLEPDLVDDRIASHYTIKTDDRILSHILKNKVGLSDYLNSKRIDNDYEKGYFLHLVTDFIFFNHFFDDEYIKITEYDNFKKDLYYSYNIIHSYLNDNYDIRYTPFNDEVEKRIFTSQVDANYDREERTNIIPYNKLDNFIDEILKKDVNGHLNYFSK